MNNEVNFWGTQIGKFVTDFIEGAVAVLALVNLSVFLQYITVTSTGIHFDRGGAVDELALIVPSVATGIMLALVAAARRRIPAAEERIRGYVMTVWTWVLAKLRG